MHQQHSHVTRQIPVQTSCRRPQEIVHFGCNFHAGEPTTSHNKGQQLSPTLVVRFNIRLMQHIDQVISQSDSIGQRLNP